MNDIQMTINIQGEDGPEYVAVLGYSAYFQELTQISPKEMYIV